MLLFEEILAFIGGGFAVLDGVVGADVIAAETKGTAVVPQRALIDHLDIAHRA